MQEETVCGAGAAFELHSFQINSHEAAIKSLAGLPHAVEALLAAVDRLNVTMDRLDESTQTKTACAANHLALENLRAEQLFKLRADDVITAKVVEEHVLQQMIEQREANKRVADLEKVQTEVKAEAQGVSKTTKLWVGGLILVGQLAAGLLSKFIH